MLLCDFHREEVWERWTFKKDNGVTEAREDLLAKLRQICKSTNHHLFDKALNNLKEWKEWKSNSKLRNWFENTWLKHKKVCKTTKCLILLLKLSSLLMLNFI